MKTPRTLVVPSLLAVLLLPLTVSAQVNSGSNGSDGAFNPTQSLVIDMADHPDGIYQYTSVNIPAGVTVSFIPNANNRPVVWLVQGNCAIAGNVDISGQSSIDGMGARGGPGGYPGGSAGNPSTPGSGPGGGVVTTSANSYGSNASYGTVGVNGGPASGVIYGNIFILPLIGGSGGAGSPIYGAGQAGGAGGGGAILIAASGQIILNGSISANGGSGLYIYFGGIAGGCGSGGAIRLVATSILGTGSISAGGGGTGSQGQSTGGSGRIRFDTYQNNFGGGIGGVFSQGFQPIIFPAPGQGIQLAIQSIGGVVAPANPGGVSVNPDIIIPAQQSNPIPVVVHCTNILLNTEISVVVRPTNGPEMQVVGINNVGTLASSTATVSLNMPRGGGVIYARAVTGIAGTVSTVEGVDAKVRSLAETGWTADGEIFAAIEIKAGLGGQQSITYLTATGKRYLAN